MRFRRLIPAALLVAGLAGGAAAAELAGIILPDIREAAGARLLLNGIAVRTYSFLGIRIYVAGLYLERRSRNPEAILDSPETKLLEIHFVHNVGVGDARQAWLTGFASNCTAPCRLDPREVARFVAAVPAIRAGEISMFLFTPRGLTVTFNGHLLGTITDPNFARAILESFIGPVPPTPQVKRGLLGEG